MEHKPNHIDEQFRSRLMDAAPPPPTFVWDNIERELQKKRRRFFFWLLTLAFAGLGIVGAYTLRGGFVAQNQINEKPLAVETSEERAQETPDKRGVESVVINSKNALPAVSVSKPITQTRFNQANKKPQQNRQETFEPKGNESLVHDEISETESVVPEKPVSPKTTFELGAAGAGLALASLPAQQASLLESNTPAISATDLIKKTWPEPITYQKPASKAKKTVKNCYEFSKKPSVWLLEAYTGPSLAQRELVSKPEDKSYLNKRLNTEKRGPAFNSGIRASLMIKGNLLLRTGFHYDQMTEVFEYIDPAYVRTIVVNVYDPNTGMSTLDTVGVEYGEKYQKTYNRYGFLDIPLMAGIEMRKGRSGFNLNAGVSVNLLFWKRGTVVSPITGEPAWFTPNDGTIEVFKANAGLSATASIQWFYHLKPRWRIFVEPYFKRILNPVTVSSHPVEQRYSIGGLRLGVAKILN